MIRLAVIAASLVAFAPAPAPAGRSGEASPADKKRPASLPTPAAALETWAKERNMTWDDLAFVPDPKLAGEAREAWSWLVPGRWRPILCAMVGGIFLETESGTVSWLDIGTGTVEEVAPSVEAFEATLRSGGEKVENWFLPALVDQLHRAGKRPRRGQAYHFLILPVFKEGKFVPENMVVISAREQLLAAADIHRQLVSVPDGTEVEIVPEAPEAPEARRRPKG